LALYRSGFTSQPLDRTTLFVRAKTEHQQKGEELVKLEITVKTTVLNIAPSFQGEI
jgi:hypothetical protein